MESSDLSKQRLEVLEGQMRYAQHTIEALTRDNQGFRTQNLDLAYQLQQAQEQIYQLERQVVDLRQQLQESEESNQMLESEVESLREEKDFSQQRLSELEPAYQESRDYIFTLEQQIEIGGQQLQSLDIEKQEIQQQFQELQQQFQMLERTVAEEREQFSQCQHQLEEQLIAAQSQLEDVDVNYYRDEYHHIVRMLNESQTSNNKLRNQVFDLESFGWEKDTEIVALKKTISDLRKELSDFYRDDSLAGVCRQFTTLKV